MMKRLQSEGMGASEGARGTKGWGYTRTQGSGCGWRAGAQGWGRRLVSATKTVHCGHVIWALDSDNMVQILTLLPAGYR